MAGRCVSHRTWIREWASLSLDDADTIKIGKQKALANSGHDAWGRPRPQPIEMSMKLYLNSQISRAAAYDSVDASTVHYGKLSKLLNQRIEQYQEQWMQPDDLAQVLVQAAVQFAPSTIAAVELQLCFMKTAMFGDGLSLILSHAPSLDLTAPVVLLKDICLPALIGVNPHERVMKQPVLVSVQIDRTKPHISEQSFEIEQLVVKTVEESSFETLESLSESIAACIIKFFIFAKGDAHPSGVEHPSVKVKIKKPRAIPNADAPAVEIQRRADPEDSFGRRMLGELGNKRPQIPFPLEGRLDEFLRSWKQD
ncbi:MAG: hypothetical protein M1831_006222 [Alyxoria varia]|nr:MAG: hypothetical protein M1831_006222 [Alyxoria varia]